MCTKATKVACKYVCTSWHLIYTLLYVETIEQSKSQSTCKRNASRGRVPVFQWTVGRTERTTACLNAHIIVVFSPGFKETCITNIICPIVQLCCTSSAEEHFCLSAWIYNMIAKATIPSFWNYIQLNPSVTNPSCLVHELWTDRRKLIPKDESAIPLIPLLFLSVASQHSR